MRALWTCCISVHNIKFMHDHDIVCVGVSAFFRSFTHGSPPYIPIPGHACIWEQIALKRNGSSGVGFNPATVCVAPRVVGA